MVIGDPCFTKFSKNSSTSTKQNQNLITVNDCCLTSTLCFKTFCRSVCLSVGMFPRHGYSFKDTTVWSSPNDSKCLRLGVSVLKISNLPIPEVAF